VGEPHRSAVADRAALERLTWIEYAVAWLKRIAGMSSQVASTDYGTARAMLAGCFFVCLIAALLLHARVMSKIRDDSKSLFFRYSFFDAVQTNEFWICISLVSVCFVIGIVATALGW
jgi:hypothetical protein